MLFADSIPDASVWAYQIFDNRFIDYVVALGVFVGLVIAFWALQLVVARLLERAVERTETKLDNALVAVVRLIRPPFYTFVAFYAALRYLVITGLAEKAVRMVLLIWLVYQVVRAVQIFVEYYVEQRLVDDDDASAKSITQLVHSLLSIALWAMGGLFVLSNLGVDVTSLIAGLGIGGIAVALAAQNILGDLFSSLAIYLDKPFALGDFVEVGSHKGTVQHVGIKTTRITSISGEEIVVPNKELTNTSLANFGRMTERRVSFDLGVVYETPSEKMEQIPGLVQQIIDGEEQARFDRAHFKEMTDSSLSFEVVYFVETREYAVYMDINQRILLGIKRAFELEAIDMAFPTRTVHLLQS